MVSGIRRIDFGVNCYLIDAEGGYILIDTSFPSKQDKLDAELAAAGCGPDGLRLIVLTHGDVDHAGNSAHLRRTLHAPIAIHRNDAEMVRSGDMGSGRKDQPDRHTIAFRILTRGSGLLNKFMGAGEGFEAFEPDVLLEDGQDLSVYGLDARVVHLPGHSSGSIGVVTGDGDLFCGDLLVNVTKPSVHFYIDDLARADESIRKLNGLGVETVHPGHGKPFPLAQLPTQGRSRGRFLRS
ncbi:MAG: MBL fold metallo-hydrolase [Coriobacteriia bacterium]|nr:MBL fold metallo-hydrolase [Coriobacteriia bacterium]